MTEATALQPSEARRAHYRINAGAEVVGDVLGALEAYKTSEPDSD